MLKPLNDNVVIEPVEIEKKTASGIILTGEAATPTHAEGIVVAVGESKQLVVGNRVIYNEYAANKVNYDGKELVILPESDILAVVEGEK